MPALHYIIQLPRLGWHFPIALRRVPPPPNLVACRLALVRASLCDRSVGPGLATREQSATVAAAAMSDRAERAQKHRVTVVPKKGKNGVSALKGDCT